MKKKGIVFLVGVLIILFAFTIQKNDKFITYEVNLKNQKIDFFWKDSLGNNFSNFLKLKNYLEKNHKKLIFATNGGMYKKDGYPQGLYIEKSIEKNRIETNNGDGNFYLKPNGVFYLTKDKKAKIISTENFKKGKNILYATQSGPMLLIEGKIHSTFNENSKNLNIRNGVGILPNGNLIFVMSKQEINFYEFANYFKQLNCKNALYLDGFVSRTYLPEKNWEQLDGNFGVIIAVTK